MNRSVGWSVNLSLGQSICLSITKNSVKQLITQSKQLMMINLISTQVNWHLLIRPLTVAYYRFSILSLGAASGQNAAAGDPNVPGSGEPKNRVLEAILSKRIKTA